MVEKKTQLIESIGDNQQQVWHKTLVLYQHTQGLLCIWAAGNRVLHLWPGHSGGKTNDRRRKSALTCLSSQSRPAALEVPLWRTPPPDVRKLEEHTETKDIHLLILQPLKSFKNETVAGLVHYKWATLPTAVLHTYFGPSSPTLADLTWRFLAQNLPLVCFWHTQHVSCGGEWGQRPMAKILRIAPMTGVTTDEPV